MTPQSSLTNTAPQLTKEEMRVHNEQRVIMIAQLNDYYAQIVLNGQVLLSRRGPDGPACECVVARDCDEALFIIRGWSWRDRQKE